MMKSSLVRSAALLTLPLFAATAFAAQPEQKPVPEKAEETEQQAKKEMAEESTAIVVPEVKEEKRICRRIATDMSSRRKERVCLTAEGWRDLNNRR